MMMFNEVYFFRPEFCQDMNGIIPRPIKERKKHDRFNGMPEEEVSKRTLPDHLTTNLDIIIVSIPKKVLISHGSFCYSVFCYFIC